jgi:hypothetical protein
MVTIWSRVSHTPLISVVIKTSNQERDSTSGLWALLLLGFFVEALLVQSQGSQ